MEVDKIDDLELYQTAIEYQRIGNSAVKRVQEENKKRGIPNVYSRNGKIYYELPNGELTFKNPFKKPSK